MINLIPKEEKRRMTIDFYSRLAFVSVMVLNFCILAVFFLLLPSYFIVSVKQSLVNQKLQAQKAEPLPAFGEQSIATIKDINGKLALVDNAEKNKFLISDRVINAVLLGKRPDVKITQISFTDDPTTGKKISIIGVAPSREVLLLFRQSLQDNPTFKNINLPISNFVKGSNIQFSLDLTPS